MMQQQPNDGTPQKNPSLIDELKQTLAQQSASESSQALSVTPQPVQKSRVLPPVPQNLSQLVINAQSLPSLQTTDVQIDTKLQAAFKALQKDQENKLLIQQFKNIFLEENIRLIENLQIAISDFCQNPHNQKCKIFLEKSLSEIYLKIRKGLEGGSISVGTEDFTPALLSMGTDDFALALHPIIGMVVSQIKGLVIQHIQLMYLLLKNWESEENTQYFGPPREMMPVLLHQMRLLFPSSSEQHKAYEKLQQDIDKINQKGESSDLFWMVHDYFENRLFYDQKETLILIQNLKKKGIVVPQCLFTVVNEFEDFSKENLILAAGERLNNHGYMLNPAYINFAMTIYNPESDCYVTTCCLLSIFKLNGAIPGKHLFFFPGHIQIVFEGTEPGLRFKEYKFSNSVLKFLMTEEVKVCNEQIFEAMVAQAKKEESPESLYEWYRAQSRIVFSKDFSEKYQGIFDCGAFKKKFEEEASEFLNEYETLSNKLKFGFEKLFFEDKKEGLERYKAEHNEEYKFICNLYSVIIGNGYNSNLEGIKIPLPMPSINLNYYEDNLCITVSPEAVEFMAVFEKHDAKLKFIDFRDKDGSIRAVFKNPTELKTFLIACGVPNSAADKMADNLYTKHILTLDALENSSNSEIIALKKQRWTHTVLNDQGEAFARDNISDLKVNGQVLNPAKQLELMPGIIDDYAKEFPLIKDYRFTHSQKFSYLFEHAISGSLCKVKSKTSNILMVVAKNSSVNVELTKTSASCITDNNLLIIFDRSHSKGKAALFSIPGHIQTVFEMVGQYQLQAISSQSQEPVPSDMTLQNNPQKLYLYLDGEVLTYAVYHSPTSRLKRIVIKDDALGEKNAENIRKNLKMPSGDQYFDLPQNAAALLLFLKLAETAGFPILGAKLKTIKISNSVLRDLIIGNIENCDEEIFAKMVVRAKQEEPKESLYEWYKAQAVIFAQDYFRQNNQMTLNWNDVDCSLYTEVQEFIYKQYEKPADKFYQFIDEVQSLLAAEERLLTESKIPKIATPLVRQLPKKPLQTFQISKSLSIHHGDELQETFNQFIKNQDNSAYKKAFQKEYLNANKTLLVKVEKAIADFIDNPQKQFNIFFLEKCLSDLSAKIHLDLQKKKVFGMDETASVLRAILEPIMQTIKGLKIDHIFTMKLLVSKWEKQDDDHRFSVPIIVMNVLIDQVQAHFPLSLEQNQARLTLESKLGSEIKLKDYPLSLLNADEFDNLKILIGSDFPRIQEISLKSSQYKNYYFNMTEILAIKKKLDEIPGDKGKALSTKFMSEDQMKKLNLLLHEVEVYFDNRFFSNQEKTQQLIEHLNSAGISVPPCVSPSIRPIRALPKIFEQQPNNTISTIGASPQKNSGSPKNFKFVLTLEELKSASNEHLIGLKKQGWIYVVTNNDGKQFDSDVHRKTAINKQPLKPDHIQDYAKQYPLINKYARVHTQAPMSLFFNAITKNIGKARFCRGTFDILCKNDSTNVEITQSSACLETDNDFLFIMNSQNLTPGKSYSIPGSIQTVVEMTGEYNLKIIRAEEAIPADDEIRKNPNELYLYVNKSGLLEYAVCNKINEVQRIVVKDNELDESNCLLIKNNLNESASKKKFDDEAYIEALYAFFKIISKAGFPIAGLKLKAIKASNKVLLDLMVSDYKEFNAEILEKLVKAAKQEEPRESLYEWYKNQAKIFFDKKFFRTYDFMLEFGCNDFRQKFLIEVNQFLLNQYSGDKSKFKQFLLEFYQEDLESRKKLDEGIEPLCEWYKDMAKFFFSENFVSCCSGMLDCHEFRQKFIIDVSLFISQNYNKPQDKFQEFISGTGIPEFLNGEEEPKSLFGGIISGFDNFLKEAKIIEELPSEKIIPQKFVRSLPSPGYGLHSTIECSEKHKFILSLYLCITRKEGSKELPSPVPEVSLKEDGSLSITIPEDDKKFTSAFKEYNEMLFNQYFKSYDKINFVAAFKNESILKQFLLACNMQDSNIDVVLPNLYQELRKEENKFKSNSKKVMNIETRPQLSIHSTSNFASQQDSISAELKDKFSQKKAIPHNSHKITPSRSLPLPKNNPNDLTTANFASGQQSASDDLAEFKYTLTRKSDRPQKPVTSLITTSSQLPHQTRNNKSAINSVSQQNPVSIEFKNQLSQKIVDTQGSYQTKPSGAKLVNAVRSYSGSKLLAVCTTSTYPEIDIFAKVAYAAFTEKKYQFGTLPEITLNAENGYFCIAYNSYKPKEFKCPEELKEYFSKSEGFEKVNMEKLCLELCIKQNINYQDISKKWENDKFVPSNK